MEQTLSARFQSYVDASGLTYEEIAELSTVSKSTIYRFKVKPPISRRNPSLIRVLSVLGHTPDEFFTGIDTSKLEQDRELDDALREVSELRAELAAERKLQQSLADQLAHSQSSRDHARKVFDDAVTQHKQMLSNHQKINDELRATRDYERQQKEHERKQKHIFLSLAIIFMCTTVVSLGSMVLYTIRAMK